MFFARKIWKICGNGKIDHYPLWEKLRFKKLLCISKERYENIKRDLLRYSLIKEKEFILSEVKNTEKAQGKNPLLRKKKIPSSLHFVGYKTFSKKQVSLNNFSSCLQSGIGKIKTSSYWQWKRVKEWSNKFNSDGQKVTHKNKDLLKCIF